MMLLLLNKAAIGQISPGDLAQAHAELEGIRNCTKCHIIGKKVSNDKCLSCHDFIQNKISLEEGYHASPKVKNESCAKCHSDHHGRKFDMVRFDEKNFDHELTGYDLTGAHQKVDCRDCHMPDNIVDEKLKIRNETYLGLSNECKQCHEDVHQNTLSADCASCHTTETFAPATKFNHNTTAFPLKGGHTSVDCATCHLADEENDSSQRIFSGLQFSNCTSCHSDVHRQNLGNRCVQCHNESSFTDHRSLKKFNHKLTQFELLGKHQQLDCKQCHQLNVSAELLFQEHQEVAQNDCASCHEDVHENKFGQNCVNCHNENSFIQVDMGDFNHDITNFELKGRHKIVDCRECHEQSYRAPLPHNTCASCHSDYHEGQFTATNPYRDCAECHVEEGFENSTYSIETHSSSSFPLEGAHMATPCFTCHVSEEKWQFRSIGTQCVDCHEDVHLGYLDIKYYEDYSCTVCHNTIQWSDNHFEHTLTGFTLEGKHKGLSCSSCHEIDENEEGLKPGNIFRNVSTDCTTCHENVHGDQFLENGETDCRRCHGFESWNMESFDHSRTDFVLDGKHRDLECSACHKQEKQNGVLITQFKLESFECIDCHQ